MNVIATQVTTLDEARYFAAMGADWIGFHAGKTGVDEIRTIAEWIVGPSVFVEFDRVEADQVFELMQKTTISGICIPISEVAPSWYKGTIIYRTGTESVHAIFSGHILLAEPDMTLWSAQKAMEFCTGRTCWIETDTGHAGVWLDLLKEIPDSGIALRCGGSDPQEDLFAQYDAFFTSLERIRD